MAWKPKIWEYSLRLRLILVIGIVGISVFGTLLRSNPAIEKWLINVSDEIQYPIRDFLGKSPKLDPHLKILVFDDSMVGKHKTSELSLDTWGKIIDNLSAKSPRKVIIDKAFSLVPESTQELSNWIEQRVNPRPNIRIGAVITNKTLVGRGIRHEFSSKDSKVFAYSAPPPLSDFFKEVGHLQFEGSLYVQTVKNVGAFHIPYIGLELPALEIPEVTKINLSPAQTYLKALHKLDKAIENRLDFIQNDDTILILTQLFTGGTDYHATPFGYLPGGFLIAATVNQSLQGLGISSWNNGFLSSFFATFVPLLATCILTEFPAVIGIIFLFLGLLLIGLIGIILFTFFSFETLWLTALLFMALGGIWVLVVRHRHFEFKGHQLEIEKVKAEALEREISQAKLIASAYSPDPAPDWPDVIVDTFHKSFDGATGDWYAFQSSRDQKLRHIILCDITGHGIQASLVVSVCKALWHYISDYQPELAESHLFGEKFLQMLNSQLWSQGRGNHTTTAVFLTIDRENRKIYSISAGHPFPLLRSPGTSTQATTLISRNNPIGYLFSITPKAAITAYSPKDELILYSDGCPIAKNKSIWLNKRPLAKFIQNQAETLYNEIEQRNGDNEGDDISIIWLSLTE